MEHVKQWKSSGLSAVKFAAKEGISPHTLRRWGGKSGSHKSSVQPSNAIQFIEIATPRFSQPSADNQAKPQSSTLTFEPFEIVLRNGRRVRVPVRFESSSLRHLIEILENK